MKRLLPLLLPLALVACTGRSRKDTPTADGSVPPQPAAVVLSPDTLPEAATLLPDSLSDADAEQAAAVVRRLLAAERTLRAELVERLRHVTPAQADSLYLTKSYRFIDTPAYDSLEPILYRLAERCSVGGEPLPGDSLLLAQVAASGIVIESVGEGEQEPRTERYYYHRIFQPYLTPETERFGRLLADNDTLLFSDAGLCTPLDELYRRCLAWERFLGDYPRSAFRPRIQTQYAYYLENLLFCTADNTPTFDRTRGEDGQSVYGRIYDYWLEELRQLVRQDDASHTQRIVRKYLAALEAQDDRYSEAFERSIAALYTLPE